MGRTRKRRLYGPSRDNRVLKARRQKEAEQMAGYHWFDDVDESVHERWNTGHPSDWQGCRGVEDVEAELRRYADDQNIVTVSDADFRDDAELIWGWVSSSRGLS
jgi:hypothetical protein